MDHRAGGLVDRTRRVLAVGLGCALMLGVTVGPAHARKRFPPHLDPKSWEVPEDMSWADYAPIPGVDWKDPANQPPKKLRAALILGDFQDQKFRVAETTVDATGQRGLGVKDPAQFWLDYLFLNEDPNSYTKGHNVGEYWLENSYGLVGVEAQAFGPYTMEGNMYEYGVRDFGGDDDCPDGPDGCDGSFDAELTQASLADVSTAQSMYGEFDFRFLLHAGYDESGVWLNYGQMLFPNEKAVTNRYGPENPKHRNWATTRYVDWTSFFSAQQIWSHALPGALSTQGESDGGSTYAHELSHILGVLDNYNNPYADVPDRAYSGPWDMMSRGTFNGPGGPWERDLIPPTEGGTMGSHHMLRNKIRMGFTPASEVFSTTKDALDAGLVVRQRILQRESPPEANDAGLYSGIRIALGEDASSCDPDKPLCDEGGYDYYDIEVVNRQGFDSFIPDHGVLIAKSKTADASPFIWVIDAFPQDIHKVDYVRADGEKFFYTIGDYRQLADAAFHAGTAPGTKNSYVDKENGIAFFILEKTRNEGRIEYTVAVRSTDAAAPPDPQVKPAGGRISSAITALTYEITNPGQTDAVYRMKVKARDAKARLLNDLVFLAGGETATVKVWVKKNGRRPQVKLTAKPA